MSIKTRIEKVEKALQADRDSVIKVSLVRTDEAGRTIDYYTGEPVSHSPGEEVIVVKSDREVNCEEVN